MTFSNKITKLIQDQRWWLPLYMTVSIGLAISIFAYRYLWNQETLNIQDQFVDAAFNRLNALERELDLSLDALQSLENILSYSEFSPQPYTDLMIDNYLEATGMLSIGWAPLAESSTSQGTPRYILTFIKPDDNLYRALGYDYSNERENHQAMVASIAGRRTTAGPKISLDRGSGVENYIELFHPVFDAESEVKGFLIGLLSPRLLLEQSIKYIAGGGLDVDLLDGSSEPWDTLHSHISRLSPPDEFGSNTSDAAYFNYTAPMQMGGRNWVVEFGSMPDYGANQRSGQPFSILLAGLIITAILSYNLAFYVKRSMIREAEALELLTGEEGKRREAEAALAASEFKYRQIVEVASDTVFTADLEGNFTFVNQPGTQLTGYPLDQLLEMHFIDLIAPDWRTRVADTYLEQRDKDITESSLEFPIITKNGDQVWVEQRVVILYQDDIPVGMEGIVRDISDRKLVEQALRKSEEQLRTFFTNAPLVMFSIDKDGVFTLSEGSGLASLGLKAGEVVGQSVWELYKDTPQIIETIKQVFKGKSLRSTIELGDLTFETSYRPVFNDQGEVIQVTGVANDISPSIVAAKALRESEQRFKTFANSAFEAIIISQDGKVLDANNAFCSIFGYSEDEISDINLQQLVDPEDFELVMGHIIEGYDQPYEHRALRKDGTVIEVEVRESQIIYNGIECRLTVLRDVTEAKQIVSELQKSEGFLSSIFNNMHDAFFRTSREGNLEWCSPSFARYFGYDTVDEILAAPAVSLWTNPEHRANFMEILETKGTVIDFESLVRTRDGTNMVMSLNANMIYDDDGN
ncbi:PAS domain S-box protein, partial [Candidatus Neomarinimicrobiota bacterium]